MSGRGGWAKVRVVGRPARLPEIPRSADSWWMKPECQENRDVFKAEASFHLPRIQARGLCADWSMK
jgi:hypothetical protein